jgi:hypothetical protein
VLSADKETPVGSAVLDHVVPLEVNTLPLDPGATTCNADVPLPSRTLLAVRDDAPVPPLPTGNVPVTPVVRGKPVTLVITPDAGVPNAGVVNVGLVRVLFVRVSVVALPTRVSVAAGRVTVVVPATAVACNVVVPEVEPERSIALGFRVTVVAIFILYGVPFATILVAEVITPVEDIDAIVVAPYLNNNFPPDSIIVKFVVTRELTLGVAQDVLVPSVVKNLPELLV